MSAPNAKARNAQRGTALVGEWMDGDSVNKTKMATRGALLFGSIALGRGLPKSRLHYVRTSRTSGKASTAHASKPDRTITNPLRRDIHGNPEVDFEFTGKPHTQLGTKKSKRNRERSYIQGREFDSNGRHIKDIDVTDHGRPADHTNPHQHRWIENETGGTMERSAAEPIEHKLTNKPKNKG